MSKKDKKNIIRAAIALTLVCCFYGYDYIKSCSPSELPAEANGRHIAKTSEEKNAEFKSEEERQKLEDEQARENMKEAPNEGVQRHTYEDLEQPGPIVGSREILIFKTQYIVSYNIETLCPNYVCWSLTSDRVDGDVKRTDDFHGDPSLVDSKRVETTDYNGSGYDRGHMCPAADNKNSAVAMSESFCMTNICPQTHSLNAGDWSELEDQCRQWARDYGTVYICCGPIFDKENPATIGKRKDIKISVPDRFFKVVLTYGRVPKAIGFIYPNAKTNRDMRDYCVSVNEVEKITGIDFFPQLPDDEEEKLEGECKPAAWGI